VAEGLGDEEGLSQIPIEKNSFVDFGLKNKDVSPANLVFPPALPKGLSKVES
jgi:hypothetical protein